MKERRRRKQRRYKFSTVREMYRHCGVRDFADDPFVKIPKGLMGHLYFSSSSIWFSLLFLDCPAGQVAEIVGQDDASPTEAEETVDPEILLDGNKNPKTPSMNEESAKLKALRTQKEQNDAMNSQEKIVRKPDKIYPCPRCNSMDTKFCYYNNYNVNQPRHFCKACQRYWTAGGTMRNVPVGAGRRKNKSSTTHYHHITASEALQVACIESFNGNRHSSLKTNCRVLSFGFDSPICDSIAAGLNLADKKVLNGNQNDFRSLEEQRILIPCRSGENGDDCSSLSCETVSNSIKEAGRTCPQEPYVQNVNEFASPIPCLPGVPWPCAPLTPPAFCPPGLPMSIYPAAYWNCSNVGSWNFSLLSPQSSCSSNQEAPSSGPDSPSLGKHSRDEEGLKPDEFEKEEPKQKKGRVLVPKTLRIDDPNEAAKSSIWAALGIENESLSGGGLFNGFSKKTDQKNHIVESSNVLRANPAALSRSINFHESY